MSNSRLSERAPFLSEVDVLKMGDPLPRRVWGKNLSETGVFLQTTTSFSPGERVSLRFELEGRDVHVRAAEVVWVKRFEPINVDGVLPGVGVRFLAVDPPTRAAIRSFVHEEREAANDIQESTPPEERVHTLPYGRSPHDEAPLHLDDLPSDEPVLADSLLSDIPIDSLPPLRGPSELSPSTPEDVASLRPVSSGPFAGWRFEHHPSEAAPELAATLEDEIPDLATTDEDPATDNPTVSLRASRAARPISEVPSPPEAAPSFADSGANPLPVVEAAFEVADTRVDLEAPEFSDLSAGIDELAPDEPVFASTVAGLELPDAEAPVNELSMDAPRFTLKGPRALRDAPRGDASHALDNAQASVLEIEAQLGDSELAAVRPNRRPWLTAAVICAGVGVGAFLGWDRAPDPAPAREAAIVMPAPRPVATAEKPLREDPAPTVVAAAEPKPAQQAKPAPRPKPEAEPAPPAKPEAKPTLASARPPSASASGVEFGRMAVPLEGGVITRKFGLENPSRVVVDLKGAKYPGARNEVIGEKGVAKLRIGRPDSEHIRVVIELSRDKAPTGISAVKRADSLVVAWK